MKITRPPKRTEALYRPTEARRASSRRYYYRHREAMQATASAWASKHRYGLTLAEVAELAVKQDHKCKLCGSPETANRRQRLSVDHDHDTGRVRGLLCRACNVALGLFGDNPDRLRQALRYLEAA